MKLKIDERELAKQLEKQLRKSSLKPNKAGVRKAAKVMAKKIGK